MRDPAERFQRRRRWLGGSRGEGAGRDAATATSRAGAFARGFLGARRSFGAARTRGRRAQAQAATAAVAIFRVVDLLPRSLAGAVRKRACVRGGGKGRGGARGCWLGPSLSSLSCGCSGGAGVVAGCGEGRDSHWEEPGSRLGVQRYVTFENYCNQDHIHPSYMQSYHVIAPWRHGMKTQFRCRIPEPPRGARSKHGEQQKLALRLILMQVL